MVGLQNGMAVRLVRGQKFYEMGAARWYCGL